MSSIDLATTFNIGMYLFNREKRLNAFPSSTYKMQALNELPTDIRHIKVPQDRLLCPTAIDNKKKQFSENLLSKCVTRPDLSGVPLMSLKFLLC